MTHDTDRIVAETRAWVTEAVVGLDLCPFAGAVLARDRIRFAVTGAIDPAGLIGALGDELTLLAAADPARIETTLLIHPGILNDFLDFNDFLADAEKRVERLGFGGILQVASFHPDFRFAGTSAGDIGNATNRSPYPTLHLLRESSVARAVDGWGNTDSIFEDNIRRLEALGPEGWAALERRWRPPR